VSKVIERKPPVSLATQKSGITRYLVKKSIANKLKQLLITYGNAEARKYLSKIE
jgi:hypothetical protein